MSQSRTAGSTDTGAQSKPSAEPLGDVRRGGWILVLIGVVLVLIAIALLLLV